MGRQNENFRITPKWGFGMALLKKDTEIKYNNFVSDIYNALKRTVDRFDINIDNVSIFKELINRIIRQNQRDWFTVYTMFGEPDPTSLVRIPQYLADL